jgi:hypothetical protein
MRQNLPLATGSGAIEGEGLGALGKVASGLFKEVIAIFLNEARKLHLN